MPRAVVFVFADLTSAHVADFRIAGDWFAAKSLADFHVTEFGVWPSTERALHSARLGHVQMRHGPVVHFDPVARHSLPQLHARVRHFVVKELPRLQPVLCSLLAPPVWAFIEYADPQARPHQKPVNDSHWSGGPTFTRIVCGVGPGPRCTMRMVGYFFCSLLM